MTNPSGTGKPLPASIRIFLADGVADGVWVVEKTNWTGKALMAPRSRYKDLRERLVGPGIYVLVGPTESGIPPQRVYVGETEDLRGRLDGHHAKKDFWSRAIVFTSKDDNLNKAHIRHVEHRLIALAHLAKRVDIENGNAGSLPPLSEADQADAEAFLAEMLLIYPVLGLLAFQKPDDQAATTARLLLKGKDAKAEGAESADGFVVYVGSLARAESVPSINPYGNQIRQALVDQQVLVPDGPASLRFTQDYTFASPSTAAMVVLGRNANGRVEWVTKDGKTLKALQTEGTEVVSAEAVAP